MRVMVTGGLGFIGSALVRHLIEDTEHEVVNVDKDSYASTFGAVEVVADHPRYSFYQCDLVDDAELSRLVSTLEPEAIVHLAAESHVDRSIDGPKEFIDSNIVGTFNLLQSVLRLNRFEKLIHVSTDEVFGSLAEDDDPFNERTRYDPRSPYSASKAASDHLVRSWGETYGLPFCITNCSNNYGPFQFPEKMIPTMVLRAMRGQQLPVYGDGRNIRDWLHVEDHVQALAKVLEFGEAGRSYAIGGSSERSNLAVVKEICDLVNELVPGGANCHELIEYVSDRPGHDLRYAVDSSRIQTELGWSPRYQFGDGLRRTVEWYLANDWWWMPLIEAGAGNRVGLSSSLTKTSASGVA